MEDEKEIQNEEVEVMQEVTDENFEEIFEEEEV